MNRRQRNRKRIPIKALRSHAKAIFKAAVTAADPTLAVVRYLERANWKNYRRIYVVGAGKAGASMARGAERVLKRRITAGLLNVKYGHLAKLKHIELNECGHPLPDRQGVAGAERIMAMVRGAEKDSLVLCLISGGASALLPCPAESITLEEKQATTRLLLSCGADIHEINTIRKHISAIKGGQLARLAFPAAVDTLLLSDVIGDNLDVIGSGPTTPDSSTFAAAFATLKKYDLIRQVPDSVRSRLEAGTRGEIGETPKSGDLCFRRVRNTIIGSNRIALQAAARCAKKLGYRPWILSSEIRGETREVAGMHAAIAREIANHGNPARPPACLISGGETTVTLSGSGMGGRNQEFALAAAIHLAGIPNVVALSAGTDGTDGPTDAAGAIVDSQTLARGPEAQSFLANHDSYHYFQQLGDLVITGPTNTNVMDVNIILIGSA